VQDPLSGMAHRLAHETQILILGIDEDQPIAIV
jgi:hypothetical protein